MGTTAFEQIKLLLHRTVVMKRRNRRTLAVETLFPLMFFMILLLLKLRVPETAVPAEPKDDTLEVLNAHNISAAKGNPLTLEDFLGKVGRLLYAPSSSSNVDILISSLNESISSEFQTQIIGLPDGDSIDKQFENNNPNSPETNIWAALQFAVDPGIGDIDPNNVLYSIRINGSLVDDIDESPLKMNGVSVRSSTYISSGFLTLQTVVNEAVLNLQSNSSETSAALDISVQDYPIRPSTTNNFQAVIMAAGALLIVVSFIPVASLMMTSIVDEKESKTRQGMMMMGLRGWVFYLVWYIVYFVISLLPASIMGILAKVFGLFNFTSPFFFLLLVLCFAQSLIAFAFVISTLFDKAKLAGQVGSMMVFILFVPQYGLNAHTSATGIIAACVSSPIAFTVGLNAIFDAEQDGIGISTSNLTGGSNTTVGYATALAIIMIDTVVYLILAWYLDNVVPSEFGQSKHPLFCFRGISRLFKSQPSITSEKSLHLIKEYNTNTTAWPTNDNTKNLVTDDMSEEEVVDEDILQKGKVVIRDLVKVFNNRFWNFGGADKSVRAVDGLNLTCYEDQILALLGHNGAGKSTTIGIMTGMIEPTEGAITLNGVDLIEHMDSIRSEMGVCLQDDILFNKLDVVEHLRFYGQLKGISSDVIDGEVDRIIDLLGLQDKRNAYALNMSGGQKRKLSVGIALIGDPKIVFLDEPTSGMDPFSRRRIWEVLKEYKKGRFIFLTTHFMDEADLLGDRIAIMSHGSLRCVGSSLFLKNRFGIGYHLVLSCKQLCDHREVMSVVKKYIPKAKLSSDVGTEMEFLVPTDQVARFVKLFKFLESKDNDIAVADFGVSLTTLEEVFLKIADDDGGEPDDEDYLDVDFVTRKSEASWTMVMERRSTAVSGYTESIAETTLTEISENQLSEFRIEEKQGFDEPRQRELTQSYVEEPHMEYVDVGLLAPFWWTQVKAMLKKRFLMASRDVRSVLMQILFPAISVAILLLTVPSDPRGHLTEVNELLLSDPTIQAGVFRGAPINIFGSDETVLNATSDIFTPMFDVQTTLTDNPLEDLVSFLLDGTAGPTLLDPDNPPESFAAIVANSIDLESKQVDAIILTNSSRPHAYPMVLDIISNSLASPSNVRIGTTNDPFPFVEDTSVDSQLSALLIPIFMALVWSYVPIGFGILLMKERLCKAKHQQFVMGTPPWIYWISNAISDMIGYAILIVLIFIFFAIAQQRSILGTNAPAALVLFFVCALCLTWLTYNLTFIINSPPPFTALCVFFVMFGGIALFFVTFGLEISNSPTLPYLSIIFSFLPTFSLAYGLRQLVLLDASETSTSVLDAFAFDATGRHIVVSAIVSIIYMSIVLMADMGIFRRIFGSPRRVPPPDPINEGEDADVHIERGDVETVLMDKFNKDQHLVTVKDLYKAYKTKGDKNESTYLKAVNRLSLNIQRGECFGLLGPNGAGKTSTIGMLTCDLQADGGEAYMGGYNVATDRQKVFDLLGFCPQFNGLHALLTGEEHLEMYARIKGVQEHVIPRLVRVSLRNMDLTEYSTRISTKYSGGNKRKLNTAIALLADPKVVLLDEPSTGMDPVTRRKLWDFISANIRDRAIILTTHSMEEADALCTRIGIVVNGTLRCIGTSQHLKRVHGSGYQLEVRTNIDEQKTLETVKEFVESLVENPSLLEEFGGRLRYNIPRGKLSLAELFSKMEKNKKRFSIQDYSISQTTLEQVFIGFAKQQENSE